MDSTHQVRIARNTRTGNAVQKGFWIFLGDNFSRKKKNNGTKAQKKSEENETGKHGFVD